MYDVIYADPPWFYNSRKASYERWKATRPEKGGAYRTRFGGGAERHYPLMRLEELLAMRPRIDQWAAANCALFMWATCPRLDSAIALIKGWGFRYCTVAFVWEKVNRTNGQPIFNPGYYTASNAELVLLGCRGSMRPARPMLQQIIKSPRREHSRKPDEVRLRIEEMYPQARRIEMFARRRYEGWDSWGLEVGTVTTSVAVEFRPVIQAPSSNWPPAAT